MPNFAYSLQTADGGRERGVVVAPTYNEALARVHRLGGVVLSLKEKKAGVSLGLPFLARKVSLKDRIIFTQQLSVMLQAGITLIQALKGVQEETNNRTLASLLAGAIADVEAGKPLSEALAKYPGTFSRIYCQMVRSAEKSGNLADILGKLTVQQQKEYELRGKVKGALMYPAIVSVILVGVIILVITFILPKLSGLFTESGTALPLSTRFLLKTSDILIHQGWLIAIGLVAVVIGLRYLLQRDPYRTYWDAAKVKVPVLGSFLRKAYMARFCQSFASLAQAGIPVLEVFETLKGVVGNAVYEREIERIARDVENGIKVSVAIRKSRHFPGMIGQLVSVGELSGDLAGIFTVLGDFFDKEVDAMAKNLSTLLEPIIMVIMGVAIGFVLISVLQPMYSLVNTI